MESGDWFEVPYEPFGVVAPCVPWCQYCTPLASVASALMWA
jgi:hypothetical protein